MITEGRTTALQIQYLYYLPVLGQENLVQWKAMAAVLQETFQLHVGLRVRLAPANFFGQRYTTHTLSGRVEGY